MSDYCMISYYPVKDCIPSFLMMCHVIIHRRTSFINIIKTLLCYWFVKRNTQYSTCDTCTRLKTLPRQLQESTSDKLFCWCAGWKRPRHTSVSYNLNLRRLIYCKIKLNKASKKPFSHSLLISFQMLVRSFKLIQDQA